jgi:copper oxidase (laccase) domain-containing protein
MYAAIGPGVCKDCYEMGDEIYEEFASEWGKEDADRILSRYPADNDRGWKYHLDLAEANRLTLLRAGIAEEHIAVSNVCTKCNADIFYSYRAGRQENDQCAMMVNEFNRKETNGPDSCSR